MKVYISGSMRGYPQFNFPAFDEVAAQLRAQGHEVFSPAEHDRETGFDPDRLAEVTPAELREMLAWDCARILEADLVALLPGWSASRGAMLEVHLARTVGIPCRVFIDGSFERDVDLVEVVACLCWQAGRH